MSSDSASTPSSSAKRAKPSYTVHDVLSNTLEGSAMGMESGLPWPLKDESAMASKRFSCLGTWRFSCLSTWRGAYLDASESLKMADPELALAFSICANKFGELNELLYEAHKRLEELEKKDPNAEAIEPPVVEEEDEKDAEEEDEEDEER